MTFDNTHYRITTRVSGKEHALDVSPDGSGRVMLSEPEDSSGQFWKLAPISDSHYALRTAYLGDGLTSTVPTGQSPIVVHPNTVSESPEQGYLYEAPYGVGDSASVVDGNSRLTLTVLQQFGSCYHLKLGYVRQYKDRGL